MPRYSAQLTRSYTLRTYIAQRALALTDTISTPHPHSATGAIHWAAYDPSSMGFKIRYNLIYKVGYKDNACSVETSCMLAGICESHRIIVS